VLSVSSVVNAFFLTLSFRASPGVSCRDDEESAFVFAFSVLSVSSVVNAFIFSRHSKERSDEESTFVFAFSVFSVLSVVNAFFRTLSFRTGRFSAGRPARRRRESAFASLQARRKKTYSSYLA